MEEVKGLDNENLKTQQEMEGDSRDGKTFLAHGLKE